MINEEKKYELIKFVDGEFSLDVNISPDEETVWLNAKEIALLFDRDYKTIMKHINNIFLEGELNPSSNSQKMRLTGNDKPTIFYSLKVIEAIGNRIKSKLSEKFYKWSNDKLAELNDKNRKNGLVTQFIKFSYDEISLDVSVSPNEDTVWLTANQMALLFEKDEKTIRKHINNVFDEKEVDSVSNTQKMRVANASQPVNFYSLNVIISVGYRVKSRRGVIFRQWAYKVLSEYLLKGSVIDEKRCLVCESNVLDLQDKYNKIKKRLDDVEQTISTQTEELIFEGEIVKPYDLLRKIFFLAKKELIIIDNYADKFLISMLEGVKVPITIITSLNSYLNNAVIPSNILIKYNDIIHDRFIISDNKIYNLGNSIKDIGKKRFVMIELKSITKEMILKEIIK